MTDISFKSITLFSQLSDEALASVTAALTQRRLAAGEILFNQGDPGDELIVVRQGKIAIFVPTAGAPAGGQAIRHFQPGEMLGEMALIDRKPRSVSARAEEPSEILALSGEAFRRMLTENPETALSVMAGLSERIRYTTDFLGEVRTWVRRMAEGNYQSGAAPAEAQPFRDPTLSALAAEFAQMAARVQEREDTLRQEVARLRIEIDESKRKQDAEQIMGTEYYQSLKEKVKSLRRQRDE